MEVVTAGTLSVLMSIAYAGSKDANMKTKNKALLLVALLSSYVLLFLTSTFACCTII